MASTWFLYQMDLIIGMALLLCNCVVFHMHKNTSIKCVSFKHNKINLLQLHIGLRMTEEGGGGIIVSVNADSTFLRSKLLQFTRQWRITKRSNAIILNMIMGMLFYLILRTSNISQLYRKIIMLIYSIS